MIKKTLIVTLQEVDPHSKLTEDLCKLLKANSDDKILIEFAQPSGKFVVEKKDIYNGIREIEDFYGMKNSLDRPIVVNPPELTEEEIKSLKDLELSDDPTNKELEEAKNTVWISPEFTNEE